VSGAFERVELHKLYSSDQIRAQVEALAQRIAEDLRAAREREGEGFRLVLVGVLSGAEPFMSDLARALSAHFPPGLIEKEYVALSSYREGMVSGAVRFLLDTKQPLTGAHVCVVEDIVDTGKTIEHLVSLLDARAPASLQVCALIDKTAARVEDVRIDYVGFETDEGRLEPRFALAFLENSEMLPFEWRSVLSFYEQDNAGQPYQVPLGPEQAREIRVNDYLTYKGYRFFQTNAIPDIPTYSGVGVVYDPGIEPVLVGMYTVIAGASIAFLLRPMVKERRKRGPVARDGEAAAPPDPGAALPGETARMEAAADAPQEQTTS